MDNDLISREALKKAFEDTVCIEPMPYAFVKQIIDNAPTVEPQKWQIEFLKRIYEEIKPHGEWVEPFESNGKTYHKCTHCHISSELILFGNFCPNCGADMRGNNNETN